MMITGILGLTVLVTGIVLGIKYFSVEGQGVSELENINTPITLDRGEREVKRTGVIEGLSEESVTYLDLEEEKSFHMSIGEGVAVSEKNGEIMPFATLELGDIVELTYNEETEQIEAIRKLPESWTKKNVIGLKQVDGGKCLIWDQYGQPIALEDIGEYDSLDLKGIDEKIYAIKVIERQGYVQLDELPSLEGVLEIDINRQIPLKDSLEPVSLTAGTHKLTINLKGYEPVTYTIEVKPGEILTVNLSGAKLVYGQLEVQVLEGIKDYEIHVGKEKYKPGERIEVLEGKYDVVVVAPDYKPWGMNVEIAGHVILQVTLQEKEGNEKEGEVVSEIALEEESVTPELAYRINVMTEPIGAKVYINGEERGVTPFTITLEIGDYSILLKKEGYEDYSTSIIIDHSDNQHNYLYMLTPKNGDS